MDERARVRRRRVWRRATILLFTTVVLFRPAAASMPVTAGDSAIAVSAPAAATATAVGPVVEDGMVTLTAPLAATVIAITVAALAIAGLSGGLIFAVAGPAMRRIRRGEALYRTLFDNLRGGGLVLEADAAGETFVVRAVNRRAAHIDELIPAQAIGRDLAEIVPSVKTSGLLDVLRRVRRSGLPENVPVRLRAEGGLDEWREHYVFRLASGEIVVIYDDVSEQKRAEEALKESETRWRSIIEIQSVAVMIIDHKHEIRYVNKAAEALFGQSARELAGAPFGFPVVQRDIAEIEIIRPGKGLAYAEMRVVPIRWSGQDSYLLFLQDVSSHKRAEGDLRKLFQAIEQSPVSVVITNVDGIIEYVNPKFAETTGYTYAEVVGKSPRLLKSGEVPAETYAALWSQIKAGRVWRGEFLNRKKSGTLFWELASIAPVRDPNGKITHYVGVKEDITERKATEERLRLSQRLEVIGQLTGGLAHDFNNLLAIIVGNLQLIEEHVVDDRECQELIADAIWSAERGAQLTHRLLAFARRQRLNPKLTDLNLVVGEMTDLLRRTLGERIQVQEVLVPGLWPTMIDRGQLESALLNLVVNARDAMPKGGVLTIATGNVVLPAKDEPRLDGVAPGNYVSLAVSDTGTGMPPEVLERIFEPFFTTKRFGQGSGLGLSMVYGFVRQSGGEVIVTSEVDLGTAVKLYLPRVDPPAVTPEPVAPTAASGRKTGGETILVVEDDERVRRTTANILARHGYTVLEAEDANSALSVLDGTRVDLLFTDVVLPNGPDGTELARQVVARWPSIRVLFTSGYAADVLLRGANRLPDRRTDLLQKPFKRHELTAKVRETLDRAG